jgi:hypothetical protein
MHSDTANRITTAACNVFLFMDRTLLRLEMMDAAVVCQCSAAQIETATDVVAAENAGRNLKITTLSAASIPAVKSFAAKLRPAS